MLFSKLRLAVAGLAVAACATIAIAADSAITVADQKLNGDSVTVAKVTAAADGFLAIHRVDKTGAMRPAPMGNVAVKKGDNANLVVKLRFKNAPKAGTKLMAVLHEDTDKIGKFQFNSKHLDVDKPMMANGAAISATFVLQ